MRVVKSISGGGVGRGLIGAPLVDPKGGTSSGAWAGEGKEGEGKEGEGKEGEGRAGKGEGRGEGGRGEGGEGGREGAPRVGPTWVPTGVQTPPPQMDLIAIPRVVTRAL